MFQNTQGSSQGSLGDLKETKLEWDYNLVRRNLINGIVPSQEKDLFKGCPVRLLRVSVHLTANTCCGDECVMPPKPVNIGVIELFSLVLIPWSSNILLIFIFAHRACLQRKDGLEKPEQLEPIHLVEPFQQMPPVNCCLQFSWQERVDEAQNPARRGFAEENGSLHRWHSQEKIGAGSGSSCRKAA